MMPESLEGLEALLAVLRRHGVTRYAQHGGLEVQLAVDPAAVVPLAGPERAQEAPTEGAKDSDAPRAPVLVSGPEGELEPLDPDDPLNDGLPGVRR